jgi:DNA polymerase I-like protein with 3'-5' exonuclease and polymerase domains
MERLYQGWSKKTGLTQANLDEMAGTVHDEIILEVQADKADESALVLRNTMIEAGSVFLKKVPVDAAVKVIDNWAGK